MPGGNTTGFGIGTDEDIPSAHYNHVMLQQFVQENEASRRELEDFISQLRDSDLEQQVGDGWTVSTVLCHLGFWDQRALYLLRQWRCGEFEVFRLTAQAIDSINEAGRTVARAVPGQASARLALDSAEAIDSEIAQIGDDLIEKIRAAGLDRTLKRSAHRRAHLGKLKEVLPTVAPGRNSPVQYRKGRTAR